MRPPMKVTAETYPSDGFQCKINWCPISQQHQADCGHEHNSFSLQLGNTLPTTQQIHIMYNETCKHPQGPTLV